MKTFREELRELCEARGMTIMTLAKKLHVNPSLLSIAGTKKGISYNKLEKILSILKADGDEAITLRSKAKFATPRDDIKINNDFIWAVQAELFLNDADWSDYKQVCKTVLRFAGVKAKVK